MRKVWLVVKREYLTRVKTKAFVITTILLPAGMVGFIAFEIAVAKGRGSGTIRLDVVDASRGLAGPIKRSLQAQKLPGGKPAYAVERTWEQPAHGGLIRAQLIDEVRTAKLDGFLWIPADALTGNDPQFVTRSLTIFTEMDAVNTALRDAALHEHLQGEEMSAAELNRLIHGMHVQVIRITSHGLVRETGQALFVAYGAVITLYISLVTYGVRTMRSVMEEKTTRVIEILLSSVRPFQLMAGKILGVAAAGFTQLLIWAVCAVLMTGYGLTMARALSPGLLHIYIPTGLLIYMLIYFIGGYFLYSCSYAAVGAMVSTEQEAQQLQGPVTMLLAAGFLLTFLVVQNPNSLTSTILSIVPFFSPTVMMMRIGVGAAPTWQVAFSLGLLALTAMGMIYVTARIYRVGVLMYGKRPSLIELLRWLPYS